MVVRSRSVSGDCIARGQGLEGESGIGEYSIMVGVNKYFVEVVGIDELVPPIGNRFKYCAKAVVYKLDGNKTVPVKQIGEYWGETKQEASRKAHEAGEQWIRDLEK